VDVQKGAHGRLLDARAFDRTSGECDRQGKNRTKGNTTDKKEENQRRQTV
jgi:hypothetical protein